MKSSITDAGQYVNAWVGNATSHRNCGAGHCLPATHATSATGTGPGGSTINRHNAVSTTPSRVLRDGDRRPRPRAR